MTEPDAIEARVLYTLWDENSDNAFLWSCNGCAYCNQDLTEGESGMVWGEPVGDGQYAVVHTYCSEKCAERAILEWHEEGPNSGQSLAIFWHGG